MPITADERLRIAAAVRSAEQRTSGEIVCVVAKSSSDYSYVPLVWAAFIALATPWPLIELTGTTVQRIYIVQLVIFIVSTGLLSIPALRMRLVPRAVKRRRAHRAAAEQFMIRGMTRTRDRTGVLIFVSIAERYARIIADDGIAAAVPQHVWEQAVDRLVTCADEKRVAEGFVQAIDICAATLAGPFPRRTDTTNELPDQVYVI